jgi:hypothetical protein
MPASRLEHDSVAHNEYAATPRKKPASRNDLTISSVVQMTVRISTSNSRTGTNSAHASVHKRMIAG